MTNKLRNNTIKSYKTQNQNRITKKNKMDLMMYFTSKITPQAYKTIISKNSI